jgi:signal transduction histidine kinase/ligand-binding sensor domain-containing protein
MQRAAGLLACLFICTNLFAQQYPFVHYTPKDGLINSRVRKAFQDSKGRIYFLTYGGLSIYDGARFKNYTTADGLGSNLVNDILEVGNDSLLIASNTGNYLNMMINGKIKMLKDQADYPVINQFYKHNDGNIYLSSDNGLFILEGAKTRSLNVSLLNNLDKVYGTGNWLVFSTSEMNKNFGLYLYDIKNDRIVDSIQQTCFLLGKTENSDIWISSLSRLFILDQKAMSAGKLSLIAPTGVYNQIKDCASRNIAFGKAAVWLVYQDEHNRNMEITCINEKETVKHIPLPEITRTSSITNVLIDRENIIWLCNDGEGVFKVVNSPLQLFENPFGKSETGSLYHCYYSNGVTWFSTSTGTLYRKTKKEQESYYCNISPAPKIFYEEGNILKAADEQNIYEGVRKKRNHLIHFRKIISVSGEESFPKRQLVDRYGNIIAGLRTGLAVWKNNTRIYYLPFTFLKDNIEDLFLDHNRQLWVAYRYSGIDIFSFHTENPANYLQPVFHFSKDQIKGSLRCLLRDKNGLIWIGTRDDGVTCYQQEGNKLIPLRQYLIADGLTENFIFDLACDSLNNIIVGTQTGLDRILRYENNRFRIENLSKNNNYFSFINQVWTDADHAFARSFSGSLLQVDAPASANEKQPPPLLLEEIKMNAKTVTPGKAIFHHNENNLSFFAAAPSFIDEKQVRYSYFLDGSGNSHWSDTTAANAVINLINLSPGEYSLRIKAFFPSSVYQPSDFLYSFEITPPWWQTWWFRSVAVLLIAGVLIAGLRLYYQRKLQQQMAALEKQKAIEKERTRIATDMHDDLGAGLSRIKFLSETIGIKRQAQQPIEDDISKIREYSHEMIDKMGEIVWALNEKNDSLIDLLSYTRAYSAEYLSQNGILCKTEMPENFPSIFVSGEFRRNIFLTIKEALHNVVKHAQATEVVLSISINHQLKIRLKDNGTGFDINNIRSSSNGLLNMRSRVKELGGKIEIMNENGTQIDLLIPLNE